MEFGQMRDFSEFCEQLNEVRLKFQKWDSCEKTVALYYLMVGLPFANAKFLQNALDQLIQTINTPEAQHVEKQANDTVAISNFLRENPQSALCLLLNHLPLLRPGNREAACCYLETIRKILTEFITPPFKKIYNECVEIMSYVYIHPAFNKEDKKSFKHLLKQVINKVSPDNFIHSPVNESSDESVSPNPESYQNGKKRSNSLTPANPYYQETTDWSSQENLSQPHQKPRSYSLSNDKTLLDNICGMQTSSSETKLQDIILMNNQPVMKSILSWLKSLRLHKYSWIFNNLTYSQMLNLTDNTLTSIGVTKGARHKLLISLQKLRERGRLLEELEVEIMNGGDLYNALKRLKGVLQSPLQVSLGEDLPSQFVKVMGKVCTQLLMLRQPSDDNLVLFNALCDRAETMEAFTEEQKKRLSMWKEQLATDNVLPIYPQRQQTGTNKLIKDNRLKCPLPSMFTSRTESAYAQKSSSYPNMQNSTGTVPHRRSVDSVTLQKQLFQIKPSLNEQPTFIRNTKSFCVSSSKAPGAEVSGNTRINTDIESSLESLCLQMMEHALGP